MHYARWRLVFLIFGLLCIGRVSTVLLSCRIKDVYTAVGVVVAIAGILCLLSWGHALMLPMTTAEGCGDDPHHLSYLNDEEIEAVKVYIRKKYSKHVRFPNSLHGVPCYAWTDDLLSQINDKASAIPDHIKRWRKQTQRSADTSKSEFEKCKEKAADDKESADKRVERAQKNAVAANKKADEAMRTAEDQALANEQKCEDRKREWEGEQQAADDQEDRIEEARRDDLSVMRSSAFGFGHGHEEPSFFDKIQHAVFPRPAPNMGYGGPLEYDALVGDRMTIGQRKRKAFGDAHNPRPIFPRSPSMTSSRSVTPPRRNTKWRGSTFGAVSDESSE
jgi:hypothetical protein